MLGRSSEPKRCATATPLDAVAWVVCTLLAVAVAEVAAWGRARSTQGAHADVGG